MSSLNKYFEDRETRLQSLGEKSRARLSEAMQGSENPDDVADKFFASAWLAERKGKKHAEILQNWEAERASFFGKDADNRKAYDSIQAYYRENNVPRGTQNDFLDAGRTLVGGAVETALDFSAGAHSQLALGEAVIRGGGYTEEGKKKQSQLQKAIKDITKDRFHYQWIVPVDNPEKEVENWGKMTETEQETFRALNQEFKNLLAGRGARLNAKIANSVFMGFAKEARDMKKNFQEWNKVDADFKESLIGQVTFGLGQLGFYVPATMVPGIGLAAIESTLYEEAYSDAMANGATETQAAQSALAYAIPATFLEKAGVDTLVGRIFKEVAGKGKISAAEVVRRAVTGSVKGFAGEGSTEALEGHLLDFIAQSGYDKDRELFTEEAFKKRFMEFLVGGLVGGIAGGGFSVGGDIMQNREESKLIKSKMGEPLTVEEFKQARGHLTDALIRRRLGDKADLFIAAVNGDRKSQIAYNSLISPNPDLPGMEKIDRLENTSLYKDGTDLYLVNRPDEASVRVASIDASSEEGKQFLAEFNKLQQGYDFQEATGINPWERAEQERLLNQVSDMKGVPSAVEKDGKWTVLSPDGEQLGVTDSKEEAIKKMTQWTFGIEAREEQAMVAEAIGYFESVLDGSRTVENLADKKGSLAEAVRSYGVGYSEAVDAIRAVKSVDDSKAAGMDRLAEVGILGLNRIEGGGKMLRDISYIFKGGNPMTVIEETSEGYIKRALAEGEVTESELMEWKHRWEEFGGSSEYEDSLRGAIEMFSDLAIDYALTDGATVREAAQSEFVRELLPSWFETFIRKMRIYFQHILNRAVQLVDMREQGELPENLDLHLKRALGLDAAFREEKIRQALQAEAEESLGASPEGDIRQVLKGKLPHPSVAQEKGMQMAAELRDLYEELVTTTTVKQRVRRGDPTSPIKKTYKRRNVSRADKFFSKSVTKDLDTIRDELADDGFNFETVDDMFQALLNAFRTAGTTFSLKPSNAIDSIRAEDLGTYIGTGMPLEMGFIRNPVPAPDMGMEFGQHIEPVGKYMNLTPKAGVTDETYERGTVRFENPLVIEGETSRLWKAELSYEYGGLGREALTRALWKDGYDGIIVMKSTRRGYHTTEAIKFPEDLKPKPHAMQSLRDLPRFKESVDWFNRLNLIPKKAKPRERSLEEVSELISRGALHRDSALNRVAYWVGEIKRGPQKMRYVTREEREAAGTSMVDTEMVRESWPEFERRLIRETGIRNLSELRALLNEVEKFDQGGQWTLLLPFATGGPFTTFSFGGQGAKNFGKHHSAGKTFRFFDNQLRFEMDASQARWKAVEPTDPESLKEYVGERDFFLAGVGLRLSVQAHIKAAQDLGIKIDVSDLQMGNYAQWDYEQWDKARRRLYDTIHDMEDYDLAQKWYDETGPLAQGSTYLRSVRMLFDFHHWEQINKALLNGRWEEMPQAKLFTLRQRLKARPGDSVSNYRLQEILDYPELFENYSGASFLKVRLASLPQGTHGTYNPASYTITLNNNLMADTGLNTLLHEVQHWIQHIEGFARGASPDEYVGQGGNWTDAFEKYRSEHGEIEARTVQARQAYSAEKRMEVKPIDDFDISGGLRVTFSMGDGYPESVRMEDYIGKEKKGSENDFESFFKAQRAFNEKLEAWVESTGDLPVTFGTDEQFAMVSKNTDQRWPWRVTYYRFIEKEIEPISHSSHFNKLEAVKEAGSFGPPVDLENPSYNQKYISTTFALDSGDIQLVGVHNLTGPNVRFAKMLGGLPVPSMAIVNPEVSDFTGFGDITLIAPPELIDPKKNKASKIFDADVYSARVPKMSSYLTNESKRAIHDYFRDVFPPGNDFVDFDAQYRLPLEIEDKGLEEGLKYSPEFQLAFMLERGMDVSFIKDQPNPRYILNDYFRKNDSLRAEYEQWSRRMINVLGLEEDRKFFNGYTPNGKRRYLAYTLEAVVKKMAKKVRGAEGMHYGPGSVRALVAKQYRTLKAVKNDATRIVSGEDFEYFRQRSVEKIEELADKADRGLFEFADDLAAMVEGDLKYLRETRGFGETLLAEMSEYLNWLKNLPTEYFEIKVLRAVKLHEFAAAIVPNSLTEEERQILLKSGLALYEYPRANRPERMKALQAAANEVRATFKIDETGPTEFPPPPDDFGVNKADELAVRYIEIRAAKEQKEQRKEEELALAEGRIPLKYNRSFLSYLALPVSSDLRRVSPKTFARIRQHALRLNRDVHEYQERSLPFRRAFSALSLEDQAIVGLALANGDYGLVGVKLKKSDAISDLRSMLDELRKRSIDSGYQVEYREGYYPRWITDLEGLLNSLGKEQHGIIRTALMKAEEKRGILTEQERIQIINQVIRGFASLGAGKPGNFEQREIERLTPQQFEAFYAHPFDALDRYVHSVLEGIHKKEFFGQKGVWEEMTPEQLSLDLFDEDEDYKPKVFFRRIDLDLSIGAVIAEELEEGRIGTAAEEQALINALRSYFGFQATPKLWNAVRSLGYATTMGTGWGSTLTQFSDIVFGIFEGGGLRAGTSYLAAVFGISEIKVERDLGLNTISTEHKDMLSGARILDTLFTWTGLKWFGRAGQNSLINAGIRAYAADARRGRWTQRRAERLAEYFGNDQERIGRLRKALAEGRKTDDVILLGWNILSDYHPMDLSEMPRGYLDNPHGRIAYMLKTFTLKQLDAYRREGIVEIRRGIQEKDWARTLNGIKNLTYLLGLLWLAGVPVDWMKDFIFGRDPQISDIAIDNIWKLVGWSRYNQYYAKQYGGRQALLVAMNPPMPWLDYPFRDAQNILDPKKEWNIEDAETWRVLPVFGQAYYWWFGGGHEKIEKKKKQRQSKKQNP